MSEYLVQRQSLENIADEIRVLSGTTEPLGLTEMATNVNDANDEVADQTDLIAQVVSALQGKSVPGGSEDVTEETAIYTDLLTDLEAAVDSLPNAGSGGGSSELQYKTGTFKPTSEELKNNPITVAGIGFKPKILYIRYDYGTANVNSTTHLTQLGKYYLIDGLKSAEYQKLVYYYYNYSSAARAIITNRDSYITIETTEDGFTITTTDDSIYIAKRSYLYIAIG